MSTAQTKSTFSTSTAQPGNLLDTKPEPTTRELVSDSLAMGVAFALVLTVVSRIIGFLRGILFCKLLSDQQLGQWSMVWSVLMLLAPLAVLGLPGCFGRFTEHYRTRGQMRTFISRIAGISFVMTLIMSGAILMDPAGWSWVVFRDSSHAGIMQSVGFALIVVTGMNFLVSLMESMRQIRLVTVMRFILGIVFATAGCGLMYVWPNGTAAATMGYAIACVIASIPAIWFLWKNRDAIQDSGDKLGHATMWKRVAPFAVWLWLANLITNMFEVADRYMLIHWSPVEASVAQGYVGQYHSGRVVPLLLVSVSTVLAGMLMPYFTQKWEAGKKRETHKMINWSVKLVSLVFTAGGAVVCLGSPILFEWILEGRYNEGMAVMPLTIVYCIWFSMFAMAQEYLWVAEKGKLALGAVIVGLLTNIGLNILLIPTFGLWGAVYATAIGNLLNLVIVYGFNHWCGCKLDLGLLLCVAIPLTLMLPPIAACLALAACGTVGWFTTLMFSSEEKAELAGAAANALGKLKSKLGR